MTPATWTNELTERTGRVLLKNTLGQYSSFLVRERENGDCEYYLGAPLARTPDGWVELHRDYISAVCWD